MTKDILKDYRGLLLEQEQIKEQLEIWEAKVEALGENLDGLPKGSGKSDPTARHSIKIAEIRDMLEKKVAEIAQEMERIETAISMIKRSMHRVIMREYYLKDKKWEEITLMTGYSIQRIWQMHGEALSIVDTYMDI